MSTRPNTITTTQSQRPCQSDASQPQPNPTTLLSLPTIVFAQIASTLSPTSLSRLRRACKTLSQNTIIGNAAYHLVHLHFIPQSGLLFCLATNLFNTASVDLHTQIVQYVVNAGGTGGKYRVLELWWSLFAAARVELPIVRKDVCANVYKTLRSSVVSAGLSGRWTERLADGMDSAYAFGRDKYPDIEEEVKAFGERRVAVVRNLAQAIQAIPNTGVEIRKFRTYSVILGEACWVGDVDLARVLLETFGKPTRGLKMVGSPREFNGVEFIPSIVALLQEYDIPCVVVQLT